jgi:hypothetical protein
MKFLYKFLVTIALQVIIASPVAAQSSDSRFEVPSSYVSSIFVDDPGCPLLLGGPKRVIGYSNGALSFGYSLTNRSKANVETFTVREIDWFGNRMYDHPSTIREGRLFSAGISDYTLGDKDVADLDPFNESLASKYGIINGPNRVWIIMVVKVKLSDGTVYDVLHKYDKLNDFINQPFPKSGMSNAEFDEREAKLRAFVADLFGPN